MNMTQRRYAVDRINSIVTKERKALQEQCTEQRKKPSDSFILSTLREILTYESIKIKSKVTMETKLKDAFVCTNLEPETKFNREKWEKLCTPIEEKAAKVKDAIMLGTEEQALKLIKEFCG